MDIRCHLSSEHFKMYLLLYCCEIFAPLPAHFDDVNDGSTIDQNKCGQKYKKTSLRAQHEI